MTCQDLQLRGQGWRSNGGQTFRETTTGNHRGPGRMDHEASTSELLPDYARHLCSRISLMKFT